MTEIKSPSHFIKGDLLASRCSDSACTPFTDSEMEGSQNHRKDDSLPCPCKSAGSFPGILLRVLWIVQCGRFFTAFCETFSTANISHNKKCNVKLKQSFPSLFLSLDLHLLLLSWLRVQGSWKEKKHWLLSPSNCTSREPLKKTLNVSLNVVSKKNSHMDFTEPYLSHTIS